MHACLRRQRVEVCFGRRRQGLHAGNERQGFPCATRQVGWTKGEGEWHRGRRQHPSKLRDWSLRTASTHQVGGAAMRSANFLYYPQNSHCVHLSLCSNSPLGDSVTYS